MQIVRHVRRWYPAVRGHETGIKINKLGTRDCLNFTAEELVDFRVVFAITVRRWAFREERLKHNQCFLWGQKAAAEISDIRKSHRAIHCTTPISHNDQIVPVQLRVLALAFCAAFAESPVRFPRSPRDSWSNNRYSQFAVQLPKHEHPFHSGSTHASI